MPTSLTEALQLKHEHTAAVPIAGGTDVMVCWPERIEQHDMTALDLSACAELRTLRWDDDALELGALTTYWDVLQDARIATQFPALHTAAQQVGAIQIQSRGTWAGNIANASPAADGVPVLMASDAVVRVASVGGVRDVQLDAFFHGYRQTDLRDDELIQSIRIPLRDYAVHQFHKVGARQAQAITKVGVAICRSSAGWRVVANSVAATVTRCRSLEERLTAEAPITSPRDLLPSLDKDVAPIDDIRSTAHYRRIVLSRVIYFGLREVTSFVQ